MCTAADIQIVWPTCMWYGGRCANFFYDAMVDLKVALPQFLLSVGEEASLLAGSV